jgi:hypothetical protein
LCNEKALNGLAVELAVGLSPGTPDRRPLAPVQHAELNSRGVSGFAHDSVEGVDFTDEVSFAQAADRRIAGHLADRVTPLGQEQCSSAQTRRRRRCFTAGMTATNDKDINASHFNILAFIIHRIKDVVSRET